MTLPFDRFIQQLAESNATLDYFTDFPKIRNHLAPMAIKLNQLNYLLGQRDLREAVKALWNENPSVFEVLDILIAVRSDRQAKTMDETGNIVPLASYFVSAERVYAFLEGTGLAEVFRNREIKNLVDYVYGIEVGLDTNARKNRGGENMSKAVCLVWDQARILYQKEVSVTAFPQIQSLGVDIKRFDFAIRTARKVYLIETNFYNSGGSKLNETARAYSDLAPKINRYPGFEFVWITDGQGWLSAKNKLEEAYRSIPCVFNLHTLVNFVERLQEEGVQPL